MAVRIYLEIGHEASPRNKNTREGFTHDWEVFVRGVDGAEIHHYVERVVFYLHQTFPKPKRVIKSPPYSVKESGYAGFNLLIDVHLKNANEPRKLTFNYDLHLTNTPFSNVQKEKHVFGHISDDFRAKLLRGGGVVTNSASIHELDHRPPTDDKNQMTSKPKLAGLEPVRKKPAGEPSREFNDIFGSPIFTTKPQIASKDSKNLEKARTKHSPQKDTHRDKDKAKERPEKSKDKKNKDRERSKDKSIKKERSPRPKSPPSPRRSKSPHRFSSPSVKASKEVKGHERKEKSDDRKHKKEKKSKDRERKEAKHEEFKPSVEKEGKHKENKVRSEKKDKKEIKAEPVAASPPKVEKKEKVKEKPAPPKEAPKEEKPAEKPYPEKYKDKHKKKDKEKRVKKEEKPHKTEKKIEKEKPSVDLKQNLFKTEPPVVVIPKKDKPSFTSSNNLSNMDETSCSSATSSSGSPERVVPIERKVKVESGRQPIKEEKEKPSAKFNSGGGGKKEKAFQVGSVNCKRKSDSVEAEEPPEKAHKTHNNVNNNADLGQDNKSHLRASPEVEKDYFDVLRGLQHKIMGLKDNSDLQKVVQLIAETGKYEVSASTFDFDLCLLDKSTVKQLQKFFASDT